MKRFGCQWKVMPFSLMIMLVVMLFGITPLQPASAEEEFPPSNAWARATPSIIWCDDPASTVTFEVHIVGRSDVARVWLTDILGWAEDEGRAELFDDGTHGDPAAGDNVFTLADTTVHCYPAYLETIGGYNTMHTMLRVELKNGTQMGNNYGATAIGMVHSDYKNVFEVQDLSSELSATAYAFFIEDPRSEVFDGYPVAEMSCGKGNYQAYQKFYSVMPDAFDFAMVMPGMLMHRRGDFAENTPYDVLVTNSVQHIGMSMVDHSAQFGSGGRLKSAIFHSFGGTDIFDHEVGHSWGMAIGQSLGLIQEDWDVDQGHWNRYSDIQGQMGAYFFDESGAVGHFAYNGDETWRLIANTEVEPYSPLELYVMGFIPPEEVPPIHILSNPVISDLSRITATYKTVTIEEIIAAEGGARYPTYAETPDTFTMAFIVVQDIPFNDAAYAYFSLMSHELQTEDAPESCCLAPFYWATGGRAHLSTLLPVGLTDPLAEPEEPATTDEPVATDEPATTEEPSIEPVEPDEEGEESEATEEEAPASPFCASGALAGLLVLPVLWGIFRRR